MSSHFLNLIHTIDLKLGIDPPRGGIDPTRTIDLDRAIDADLNLSPALDFTRAIDFDRSLGLDRDLTRAIVRRYISWNLSLKLHFLPEAFADDLSCSLPALGVCGLKGRAGDGWLVAPGWIEWDVDPITAKVRKNNSNEQWSQYLIETSYDLIFPLTNVSLGRLRQNCSEWQANRSFRAVGILVYFLLGSEKYFKERGQEFLKLFKVPHIHALMPKPKLWLKPFDEWTKADWKTCGLSALWDIESGVVYWAEGAHHADDMKRVGKPIEQFIDSKKKRR